MSSFVIFEFDNVFCADGATPLCTCCVIMRISSSGASVYRRPSRGSMSGLESRSALMTFELHSMSFSHALCSYTLSRMLQFYTGGRYGVHLEQVVVEHQQRPLRLEPKLPVHVHVVPNRVRYNRIAVSGLGIDSAYSLLQAISCTISGGVMSSPRISST